VSGEAACHQLQSEHQGQPEHQLQAEHQGQRDHHLQSDHQLQSDHHLQSEHQLQSEPAGPDELRRIFRRYASAVAVVTATYRGQPVGLLVTSLASVSTTPPLVSFNVALNSSSWPAFQQVEHVGLHVLEAEQAELADRFARKGADRFAAPTSWRPGAYDVPVLDGCAAIAVAEIEQRIPAGDHVIVVARLLYADAWDEATPLLHHDGGYHRVTRITPPSADAYPAAEPGSGPAAEGRPGHGPAEGSRLSVVKSHRLRR
jgi:flavin reductase (DIM6/NTAB) family NADH-FMN oxidoreductase RutF